MRSDEITLERVLAATNRRARKLKRRLGVAAGRAGARPAREPGAGQKSTRLPGLVEQFTKERISGWVAVREDAPPTRVSLLLNDIEVAATWANDRSDRTNWGVVRGFNMRIKDFWQYATSSDTITVRVDG